MTQFNSLTVVMSTYVHSMGGVLVLKIQLIARSNKYSREPRCPPRSLKKVHIQISGSLWRDD